MIHNGHSITQPFRFFHEVGGEENGLATVSDLPHQIPHSTASLWIKSGGQFVQEHHLRVAHQSQGNEKTLLLTAGEFGKRCVAPIGQA